MEEQKAYVGMKVTLLEYKIVSKVSQTPTKPVLQPPYYEFMYNCKCANSI